MPLTPPSETPLLFDPGEQWEYGSNIDWAGLVVEGICGKRLGEVFDREDPGPAGNGLDGLLDDACDA